MEQPLPPQPSTEEEQQLVPAAGELAPQRPRRQPTQRVQISRLFNFMLPPNYQPLSDELTRQLALGDRTWQPLAERLVGWRTENRVRVSGIHETFYLHGRKSFKSFKDARRYIYLGYKPIEANGDGPLKDLAIEQPEPVMMGLGRPDGRFRSYQL